MEIAEIADIREEAEPLMEATTVYCCIFCCCC